MVAQTASRGASITTLSAIVTVGSGRDGRRASTQLAAAGNSRSPMVSGPGARFPRRCLTIAPVMAAAMTAAST